MLRSLILVLFIPFFTGCACLCQKSGQNEVKGTQGAFVPTRSSRIEAVKYDARTLELTVRFDTQAVRRYEGVPHDVWSHFIEAGGYYGFFKTHIRNEYPSQMVQRSRPALSRMVGVRVSMYEEPTRVELDPSATYHE